MLAMEGDPVIARSRPPGPLRLLACSGSLDGGGSERQLWQLVSRLDRKRFAPEVYLLHKRGPYLAQLPADVPVHAFDVDCPAPRTFPPGHVSRLQGRHLRQVIQTRSIDVVYDRTFHMSLLTGWALPADQPRVSVIVSPPSCDLPATEQRFLRLKRWLLRRAYHTATQTICVSQEVADDAAQYYGLPRELLRVLPNPIDVQRVQQLANQQELKASWLAQASAGGDCERSSMHLAVVGRFTAEKGHAFAIAAVRALRDRRAIPVHLHFAGDGPLQSQLEKQVEENGLKPLVHFHGFQTNPYPIIRACDLVLVPSRYEGFPNVALEAMALGVPLVMTDYGPTARQLAGDQEQRARLIALNDVAQAASAIEDCWIDPGPWRTRSQQAQAWIEREHALAPWMATMMDLLEQAAATGRLAGRERALARRSQA